MRVPLVYKDKPTFGFDIGSHSVRVVQLKPGHKHHVVGFGEVNFPPETIIEGIVADPEALAKAVKPMLDKPTAGHFTAERAVFGLPAAKSFIRTLQLPPMSQADLEQAVHFEAEQYVPVPINDLYIDYEIYQLGNAKSDDEPHNHVLMVAAPRAIVDSYIKLFDFLDLELAAIETSLTAVTRAMTIGSDPNQTSLIIDFGAHSADLAIFNKVLTLTGTVEVGGNDLTTDLVKNLGITPDQANEIKYKFGLAQSGLQAKISQALSPRLQTLMNEVKKILKFYQERSENQTPTQQIIISGGSANLPGLAEFLNHAVGLPVKLGNPWAALDCSLPVPNNLEATGYATAIGLALRSTKND